MGARMERVLVRTSAGFVLLASVNLTVSWTCSLAIALPAALLAILCILVAALALHMRSFHPADSHTVKTLLAQYSEVLFIGVLGPRLWRMRVKQSEDCGKTQEESLKGILKRNKDTEYGKRYHFGGIQTREEYVKAHPLTEYSHYALYIDRLAAGEKNILTKAPPAYFGVTSGTTGKNKLYPLTEELQGILRSSMMKGAISFYPNMASLKRIWEFRLPAPDRWTSCGIPMGPASSYWVPGRAYNVYPSVGAKLTQESPSYYTQAVFALGEKELRTVSGFSSNLMYSFFKFIEKHWESLCDDIGKGSIGTTIEMDDRVRNELNQYLKANPQRAEELLRERTKGTKGLGKRIWPNLRTVFMAKSGSFSHCAKLLLGSYLSGVHVACTGHGSTECLTGTNLRIEKDDCDVFAMIPDICFMEFIPLEDIDHDNPRTFFMDQLEVGRHYEIVTTSPHGLYRFRVGDVIKVVDFFNTIPEYEFCYRVGQRLDLAFERTPEDAVYEAVEKASTQWPPGARLVDYTSTESFVIEPLTGKSYATSYYVFFMEFEGPDDRPVLTTEDVEKLDDAMCTAHEPYKIFRLKGSIAPIQVIQVASGTFEELKMRLWDGYQSMQFKMPRVQRREEFVTFLLSQNIDK